MSAEGVGLGSKVVCGVCEVVKDFFDPSLLLALALVLALWAIIMFSLPLLPYPS